MQNMRKESHNRPIPDKKGKVEATFDRSFRMKQAKHDRFRVYDVPSATRRSGCNQTWIRLTEIKESNMDKIG